MYPEAFKKTWNKMKINMNDVEFVNNIILEVLKNNLDQYKVNLSNLNNKQDELPEGEWKNGVSLYNKLDVKDKDKFISFLKLSITDTVSNLLGIIDGVSYLKGQEENFQFLYKGKKLNGNLQDIFLEEIENES